jgi:hypothetical protein
MKIRSDLTEIIELGGRNWTEEKGREMVRISPDM